MISVCEICSDGENEPRDVATVSTTSIAVSCCICKTDGVYSIYVITRNGQGLRLPLGSCDWEVLPPVGSGGECSAHALLCMKNSVFALVDDSLYKFEQNNKNNEWKQLLNGIPRGICTTMGDSVYVLDNDQGVIRKCDPSKKQVDILDWTEPDVLRSTVSMTGIGYNYIYLSTKQNNSIMSSSEKADESYLMTITQLTLDRRQASVAGYVPIERTKHKLLLCMTSP